MSRTSSYQRRALKALLTKEDDEQYRQQIKWQRQILREESKEINFRSDRDETLRYKRRR